MKKLLIMAFVIATCFASFGQDTLTLKGSKMISKEATPQQVIDSLKKKFPDAEAVRYYKTSAAEANGWTVSADDNLGGGQDIEYYTLSFKRQDFQYYGLFKADGSLVRSKYFEKGVELPAEVQAGIRKLAADKNYTDWKIISKSYYKDVDYDKQKEFYEIIAVKKSDSTQTKKVVLDATGKVIKEE